ncbi:MAG: choice-of-anchor D domain-containing protein [Nevskia sp.]|uniref:choice-of-anchor D domain-containing protein n=1 Tax=Nevskia sp. TaxID=1929292 RepID=UPI004035AD70
MTFAPLPRTERLPPEAPRRPSSRLLLRTAIAVLAWPLASATQAGTITHCPCAIDDGIGFTAPDPDDGARPTTLGRLGTGEPVTLHLSESLTGLPPRDNATADASTDSGRQIALATTAVTMSDSRVQPAIRTNLARFDFGRVKVGVSSGDQTIMITSSAGLLKIHTITVIGDYTGHHNCPRWLVAGSSCQITGRFKPKAAGERPGSVLIHTNLSKTPTEVSLTGTGF